MAGKNIQPGSNRIKEGENLEYIADEKVDVEIREIVRIYPRDFDALKKSFEEWAKSWE